MSDQIKEVTDSNFAEEVLKFKGKVLIEFGSSWCKPCERQLPIMKKFAAETGTKVVKFDIDDNPATTSKFGVRSVPTLIMFEDGVVKNTRNGLSSVDHLKKML